VLNHATSLYLDLSRFGAALVVFLTHARFEKWTGGFLWQIEPFGPRAVDVFFVLSGFVIAYVTDRREGDGRTYAISRLARIYSVALPSLLLTLVFNTIGQSIGPTLYIPMSDQGGAHFWPFVTNVLFLNEAWNQHSVFGTNLPYWSLGFEVWYYIIFGLAVFAPGRWRWIGVVAALGIAGPKVAILFPLWLAGVGGYHITKRQCAGPRIGLLLYLGSVVALICYWALWARPGVDPFKPLTLAPDRLEGYLDHYATGLLFAVHLVGFDAFGSRLLPVLNRFARPIRWAAGATFSMYLFHQPILEMLVALAPWPPASVATRMVVYLGTPVGVFVLAEVTERRKEAWHRLFARLLGQTAIIEKPA
jgi:peptidoglycan/LPS O-acetylase OafA/YrhL